MSIRLADLMRMLPPETEAEVRRTVRRLNAPIRQALRAETGLRLQQSADEETGEAGATFTVRVAVDTALPDRLESFEIEEEKALAVLLAPWSSVLGTTGYNLDAILRRLLPSIMRNATWGERFGGADATLHGALMCVRALHEESQHYDLIHALFDHRVETVHDDILGSYDPRPNGTRDAESRIEIYWGVVGLFAQVLGAPLDSVTAVVLAHELAHAYTHAGLDIDGVRWKSSDFRRSEVAIVEGLAQYYAERALARIVRQCPDGPRTFDQLLTRQRGPYVTHRTWMEKKTSPEQVRFGLVAIRRDHQATLQRFDELLEEARSQIGRGRLRAGGVRDGVSDPFLDEAFTL